MSKILNLGNDLYIKGRIGWKGLNKDEYLSYSEYKIINATSLMDGYINWDNCGYISEERYNESEEIKLKENDILISKDGTLGKIGYVKNLKGYCTVASGIFVVRNTIPDKLDFDYLYHLLKSNIFKNFIYRNKALGSTILHLYQRDLANFEIELPDINIQRKIAKILNEIDNKIELKYKESKMLEEMLETLYNYWFIQFKCVDDNKISWNEELKQYIPTNWSYIPLLEVESKIITGKTPSTKEEKYYNGDIPFITIGDIRNNMFITKTSQTLSKEGANSQIKKYIPKDSICVTCIATPGLVGFSTKDSQTNQQINSVVCKNSYNRTFLYFYLKKYFKFASGAKTGNVFANMNKDDFSNIMILYPSIDVLKQFDLKTANSMERIKNNSFEIDKLESLKSFLLPLLMNKKINLEKIKEVV